MYKDSPPQTETNFSLLFKIYIYIYLMDNRVRHQTAEESGIDSSRIVATNYFSNRN